MDRHLMFNRLAVSYQETPRPTLSGSPTELVITLTARDGRTYSETILVSREHYSTAYVARLVRACAAKVEKWAL